MTPTSPLPVVIRDARAEDMAAIQSIYTFYVTRSAASFEEVPPTVEEMTARWSALTERGMPFLVAEENGPA